MPWGSDALFEEFPHAHIQTCVAGALALEEVRSNELDIIILELNLSDSQGLQMLDAIKTINPRLPILVLSCYAETLYAYRAMKQGGAGYLSKACRKTDFILAVHKVAKDGKYISPVLVEQLAFHVSSAKLPHLHDELSNRELDVLCLLGQGEGITAIADRFHLGVNTVSSYRSRILQKLHLKTNADLIHYAIRNME